MTDMITIILVLGVGYYLYSSGKLDEILGGLGAQDGGSAQDIEQSNGDVDVDIEGENSGAMINGKCYGNQEQCNKAANLLEQIR